ncbi:pleiotropic drug resistance protein 1-like isoform X1 [Amaranthus tricolor]|uniref:pleiotropic drug resistance protein 1-like isoform X1 n=2 Tax=Amaranthus tricolor TaxID=29722 RepID=UPI00259013FB|nr:pleiotropic drug resistance protein 1-like isoform X1 [Amaranthus tricolor]
MEPNSSEAELCRVGSGRSSVWRDSGREVFSSFRDEEDDEESLKWAALEKLPTYDRVRKGILSDISGPVREIDVDKLGLHEKKQLLERLVKIAQQDHENFLLRLRERIDRVGIEIPTIEVRYEHVNVEAEVLVGSRGLPSVLNFFTNTIEGFLNLLHVLPNRRKPFTILHDVSGSIKPGRLTLLLGPPGSGKTTLLLALAGKLAKDLKFSGSVTYNGHTMNEFVPQRSAAYISQHDVHTGEMTVRETLAFSARVQGVGTNYDMLVELARREKAAKIKPDADIDVYMKAAAMEGQEASILTEYILKILGLENCADTMVGNEMIRGISGGQRKRLTTGEMLVGPAKALFMDEISTGLDSSTTFQIVNSIRQSIHILKGTALISLLQPAPETYDLFDDIVLLADGQIVYQGPREHVLEFFEYMGFRCPERKGAADFLQEVTSRKDQGQYWFAQDKPYRFVAVKEFAESFLSFHVGRKIVNELSLPFDKSKSHPAALTTETYGLGKIELFKACMSREALLMKRNKFVYVFKAFQLILTALVTSTLFLRSYMHKRNVQDGMVYMGAIFFAQTQILFNGFAELALAIAKLPVFYKQRDLRFYPAWAYCIPAWILKVPISIIETALWAGITYYVIGYDSNVGRFFKHYLVLLSLHQMASALFKCNAGLGRNMVVANTFGTGAIVMLILLGGFIMSRKTIRKWWLWGYWISPLQYGQNALSVNEFLGHSWNNSNLGVAVLESRGLFTHAHWYWIGLGALVGYVFLLNGFYTWTMTYLNPLGKPQAVLSEEELEEKQANLTGEVYEMVTSKSKSRSFSSQRSVDIQEVNENSIRGMVLPFEPLCVTFDEIRYSVDMPTEMKAQGVTDDKLELLKGVSGTFRPGVLTALMGVSGAGKTTLMDVLAGRKTEGYIDGDIRISGYPKNQETFARVSGYCEQADIHSPHVTVEESLMFSAWLRLSSDVSEETRKMFVEEVMELVELDMLRHALVGLPGVNGLSTEQRKRLTIAVELVANPSIIFMDEPTSGLDARAAAIVMRTVRNTVNTGRTVVCTIHQPSIDIFDAFDELLLLKRGGEQIFSGPIGRHGSQLIIYFEAINGVQKIKDAYNPATWMLEVTSSAQENALEVDFAQIYKSSDLYRRTKALITEHSVPAPGSKDLYFRTQYSQSSLVQFRACLWKLHYSYWRNTMYTAMRLLFAALVGVVFGSVFWKIGKGRNTQQNLFNAMGSIFSAVIFLGIQNSSGVQPVVFVERTVFYRERAAGMYSALPYAFAQVIIELPYNFFQTMFYGVTVYAMMGFEWTVAKFFWYLFFMYFTLLYFTYYGMMCVGLTPNPSVSAIISAAFYGVWNLFAGFLIPRPKIPVWWRWYYWSCPIAWSLYGLLVSQFGDYDGNADRLQDVDGNPTVREFLSSYFGYRRDFLGPVVSVILGFNVLFAVVYAYSIKTFNFQRR